MTASVERDETLLEQWRSLSSRCAKVNDALERELQRSCALGRTDYEVLARLEEGCKGSGRVTELADAVNLSQSAMSRLVDRLESQGLVQRVCCTQDRRGVYVELTDAGRARAEQARPAYSAVLQRLLRD